MSSTRLVKNTLFNGISLFIRLIISYALTPFLINSLGNEVYGVWVLMLTFTIAGTLSFFSFGFQGALVKYVAEYHTLNKQRELNEVFSLTFMVFTLVALICAATLSIFSYLFLASAFAISTQQLPAAQSVLFIFAIMAIFDLPGMAISAIIEGVQRYDILAVLDIGRIVIFGVAALVILKSGYSVVALSFALTAATVLYTLSMAICAKKLVPYLHFVRSGNSNSLKELFIFTRDLFVLRINALIYNNMDKMLVGILLNTALVTDYDIANRIHSLVLTVMGLAPSVVLPAASAFGAANDEQRQRKLLLKGSQYTTAMTLPVVVTLFFLCQPLIRFWISPSYLHVALYARLFLLYLLFWPIIQVGWNMLVGVNKVKAIIPLQIVSVAVNLILSAVLVKWVGVAGTMIGTIVGNLLIFFAYLRLFIENFNVGLGQFLRVVVVPAYLLGGVLAILLYLLISVRMPASLAEVVLYGTTAVCFYYLLFFVFCIEQKEKNAFLEMYQSFRNKILSALLS